jgi:hypothetical protein
MLTVTRLAPALARADSMPMNAPRRLVACLSIGVASNVWLHFRARGGNRAVHISTSST